MLHTFSRTLPTCTVTSQSDSAMQLKTFHSFNDINCSSILQMLKLMFPLYFIRALVFSLAAQIFLDQELPELVS